MELSGLVAVVTGASSGIGLAASQILAERGANVLMLARDEGNLGKAIDSLQPSLRPHVKGIPTDVRDEVSVQAAIRQAMEEYGKIDIVVNAAGVSMREKILVQDIDLAEWNRIMETNLTGTFLMCREALTQMTKNNSGYIINILSTAAFEASAGNSIYSASKAAAKSLTEAMIAANRRSGISVTSISPGAVDTNIWSHKAKPVSQESKDTMLKPKDIADIILFLVTRPAAVHINNITVTPWHR